MLIKLSVLKKNDWRYFTSGNLWWLFSEGNLREDGFPAQCVRWDGKEQGRHCSHRGKSTWIPSPKDGCSLLSSYQLQIKPDFCCCVYSVNSALTFPRALHIFVWLCPSKKPGRCWNWQLRCVSLNQKDANRNKKTNKIYRYNSVCKYPQALFLWILCTFLLNNRGRKEYVLITSVGQIKEFLPVLGFLNNLWTWFRYSNTQTRSYLFIVSKGKILWQWAHKIVSSSYLSALRYSKTKFLLGCGFVQSLSHGKWKKLDYLVHF